jgi:hypothetical protein
MNNKKERQQATPSLHCINFFYVNIMHDLLLPKSNKNLFSFTVITNCRHFAQKRSKTFSHNIEKFLIILKKVSANYLVQNKKHYINDKPK